MIFPLITRISADQEFRPTPSSDLQEATEKTEQMTFDSNHCSDPDYLTEGNQANEARDVCWDWVFVTFVSFCKSPKESASWSHPAGAPMLSGTKSPSLPLCPPAGLSDLCDEIALQSDPGAASLRPYKSNSTPVTSF